MEVKELLKMAGDMLTDLIENEEEDIISALENNMGDLTISFKLSFRGEHVLSEMSFHREPKVVVKNERNLNQEQIPGM